MNTADNNLDAAQTSQGASPVELTPGAVRQVKGLIAKRGDPTLKLRIGVKGGGCSGLSYVLDLDQRTTERDEIYDIDGIQVVVDRKSARFLDGTVLDYSIMNLMQGGWTWTNPNATRSCGCGTSFTPK